MVINGYSALYIENDPNNICNSILHICENDFSEKKLGKMLCRIVLSLVHRQWLKITVNYTRKL